MGTVCGPTTVMAAKAFLLGSSMDVAVIVAVKLPPDTPVTEPFSSTLALHGSLEVQVTPGLPGPSVLIAGDNGST